MAIHKLTPRKVATAGPGKYEDGGGLRLVASNTGAKKWVLRFTINRMLKKTLISPLFSSGKGF